MRRVIALAWVLIACGSDASGERERCAQCGMFVDIAPTWQTGATTAAGEAIRFDTPRCLVAWLRTPAGRDAREPWVTDYYTQRRLPAREAQYAIGSDVTGPMGADFVPVATADLAARFREDHHATRVLPFDELDPAALGGR